MKGHHVWAERYDGPFADIFEVQDSITGIIVAALTEGSAPIKAVADARRAENAEAYDVVLLGWKYLRQRHANPQNYLLAHQQFEKAVGIDPDYARATMSLAALYWWASMNADHHHLGLAFQEGIDRAQSYLDVAMRNPSALGHRLRSEMYQWEGQFDKAIAETDLAIALDRNNPEGYRAKAWAQASAGQPTQALENLHVAARLDPEETVWWIREVAHFVQGTYVEAAPALEHAVASEPKASWTYPWLISTYGHLGRNADAEASIKKLNDVLQAKGRSRYTREFAAGHVNTRLKESSDKERFLVGLEKAGVEPGGDPETARRALDTVVSRTTNGHYHVEGATIVGARQVQELLEQGAVVFDTRSIGKWRAGHVAGAVHLDSAIGELSEENLSKVVNASQPVCFYCSGFT